MQENKKSIKLQKVGTIALLCFLVVAFVGSIFCAMILPFANLSSKVASASDSVVVDSLQSQANSDYSLQNIAQYTSLYGVFFNKAFNLTYEECVANSSFFSSMEDERLIQLTVTSTSSPAGNNATFKFFPMIMTQAYFQDMGGQGTLSAPVYYVECSFGDLRGDFTPLIFSYTVASNDEDFNKVSAIPLIPVYTKTVKYASYDFVSSSSNSSVTYGPFVPSVTGMSPDVLDFWSDFLYLSLPSIGVVTTEEVLSPEYFATRFVTPTDSPSNTVYFNLDIMPKSPKLEEFKTYSSGSTSWYYYDYFQEYGTDDSLIMANDVSTVGWHVDVHKQVLPPNTTILGYNVSLRIGMTDIYSYYVSGSNFDTGAISEQKWLVSSNYTFGDMKLYKYDFSGATSYYSLLPHEEGKVLPVDSQFGEGGWNTWLALFDLSNYVSLSSDSYINIGYQNAKLYYDELIRTKTQESFLQGKNIGYELGFTEGKAQGGNYTFTSLIGAVFDAPIEAFRGLFNFEILGTNMQGFVLALLTLSVIIVVIKYALGGK